MATTTDPIKMLQEIANGYAQIAKNIKAIKVPKRSTWAKDLIKEFDALAIQNRKLTETVDDMDKELRALRSTYNSVENELAEYKSKLRSATDEQDKSGKELKNQSKILKVFGNLWSNLKRQLVWYPTKSVTFALINGIKAIPKITADYEQALVDVASISRISGTELKNLDQVIRDVGTSTKFSMVEVAKAAKILAQAGLRGDELTKSLEPISNLAAATSTSIEVATKLQTTVMRAFDMSANKFNEISDGLVNAVVNTRLSVEDLNTAFSYVASAAAQSGVTFTQTIALLGALRNAGLEASTAATGLRMALLKIAAPTRKAQKVLDRLGLSKSDLDIANKGVYEVLKSITRLSQTDIIDIFGARSANAILAIRGMSIETIERLEELVKVQGMAAQISREQLATLANTWKLLHDSLVEFGVTLGDLFKSYVIPLIELTIEGVKSLSGFFKGLNAQLKAVIATIATLTAGFLTFTMLKTSFSVITKLFGVLAPILIKINPQLAIFSGLISKTKMLFANWGFLLNPVVAGLTILLGVVAAIVIENKNFTRSLRNGISELSKMNTTLAETSYQLSEFKDFDVPQFVVDIYTSKQRKKLKDQAASLYNDMRVMFIDDPHSQKVFDQLYSSYIDTLDNALTPEDMEKAKDSFDVNFQKIIKLMRDRAAQLIKEEQENNESGGIINAIYNAIMGLGSKAKALFKTADEAEAKVTLSFEDFFSSQSYAKNVSFLKGQLKSLHATNRTLDEQLLVYKSLTEKRSLINKFLETWGHQLDEAIKRGEDVTQALIAYGRMKGMMVEADQYASTGGTGSELDSRTMFRAQKAAQDALNKWREGYKRALKKASNDNERKLVEKYYANGLKDAIISAVKGAYTTAGKDLSSDAVKKDMEKVATPFLSKGKDYKVDIPLYFDFTSNNEDALLQAKIIKLQYEDLLADGIDTFEEYSKIKVKIGKVYTKTEYANNQAYLAARKDGVNKEKALLEKNVQDRQNSLNKNRALQKASKTLLDKFKKDWTNTKNAFSVKGLNFDVQITNLKRQKVWLENMITSIRDNLEGDPNQKTILTYFLAELKRVNDTLDTTTDKVKQVNLRGLQSQISNLTAQRDWQAQLGYTQNVEQLNTQILAIATKKYKVERAELVLKVAKQEATQADLDLLETTYNLLKYSLIPEYQDYIAISQGFRDAMTGGFSQFFTDIVEGTKSVSEAFKDMGRSILKSFTDIISKQLANDLFESLFGGATSKGGMLTTFFQWLGGVAAGSAHNGGVVGKITPSRQVNPLLFANAPRFHNGLFPSGLQQNEFPAILEQGETVLPKDTRYANAVPNVTINMENNSKNAVRMKTTGTQMDTDEYIINTVIEDAANNGPMRQVL